MEVAYEPFYSEPRPTTVAPGFLLSLPGRATFGGVELEGSLYDVEMVLDMTKEGIRPISVLVSSRNGVAITGTTLRALRVWDIAREAIIRGVHRSGHRPDAGTTASTILASWGQPEEHIVRLREQGPTPETISFVALVYNAADAMGLPPAKQVQQVFGLPRATATKWIKRARNEGLLAPPLGVSDHA